MSALEAAQASADLISGAEGIRTPDLRRAKAALSQLSYGPLRSKAECMPRVAILQCTDAPECALYSFKPLQGRLRDAQPFRPGTTFGCMIFRRGVRNSSVGGDERVAGEVREDSEPGETIFEVRLPIDEPRREPTAREVREVGPE